MPILVRPHPDKTRSFPNRLWPPPTKSLPRARPQGARDRAQDDRRRTRDFAQGLENSAPGKPYPTSSARSIAARLEDRGFEPGRYHDRARYRQGRSCRSSFRSLAPCRERIAQAIGPAPQGRAAALARTRRTSSKTSTGLRAMQRACQDPDLPKHAKLMLRFVRVLRSSYIRDRSSPAQSHRLEAVQRGQASAVITRGPKAFNLSIVSSTDARNSQSLSPPGFDELCMQAFRRKAMVKAIECLILQPIRKGEAVGKRKRPPKRRRPEASLCSLGLRESLPQIAVKFERLGVVLASGNLMPE